MNSFNIYAFLASHLMMAYMDQNKLCLVLIKTFVCVTVTPSFFLFVSTTKRMQRYQYQ
jgi:hypothetical protein